MKVYIVRKGITNAGNVLLKGKGMSRWISYIEATQEVDRLHRESGLVCFITTEVE